MGLGRSRLHGKEAGMFIKVARTSESENQQAKCVEVEGKRLAVFNLNGDFYAIDDTCTHRGGSLSEGSIEGEEVICPLHGARFSIKSGDAAAPPAPQGVTRYAVRLTGEDIEVEL